MRIYKSLVDLIISRCNVVIYPTDPYAVRPLLDTIKGKYIDLIDREPKLAKGA